MLLIYELKKVISNAELTKLRLEEQLLVRQLEEFIFKNRNKHTKVLLEKRLKNIKAEIYKIKRILASLAA